MNNGILVLIVYAAIMIVTTLLLARRGTGKDDFHVADRKMGTIASAMSIAATWIWAPALFVSAEKAYVNGIPGLFWFLAPNILCLLFFIPFAKKIREQMPNGITLSNFMGDHYNSKSVKGIYGIQLGGLCILSTAVQLLAGGRILSNITGINFTIVTIILAAIAFSYSQFSGIRASVMTDAMQMILLLAGCMIFVPWALKMPGGMEHLQTGLAGISGEFGSLFDKNGIEVLLAFGLPSAIGLIAGPFGDQCFWQRAFAADRKKLGRAFGLGAILFAIVPLSMGILGFIAAGSGYIAKDTSIVNFEMITQLFPAWVVVPFLFMLISGLLSTVDSNLCAIASLTTDFEYVQKLESKKQLRFYKKSMIGLLVIGILIANIPEMTVSQMFLIYGTLRATTLLPTVFTLLKKKLKGSAITAGVTVALLTGLPAFAYATMAEMPLLKTATSLYTVLIAGIIAVVFSKERVYGKIRSKTETKK